jgi:hypothetical protein
MPAHHYGSTVRFFGRIEDFPNDIRLMDRRRKVRADMFLRNAVILENRLRAFERVLCRALCLLDPFRLRGFEFCAERLLLLGVFRSPEFQESWGNGRQNMEQTDVDGLAPPYHLSHICNSLHGSVRVFNGKQYLIGSSHGGLFCRPADVLAVEMLLRLICPANGCQHWSECRRHQAPFPVAPAMRALPFHCHTIPHLRTAERFLTEASRPL